MFGEQKTPPAGYGLLGKMGSLGPMAHCPQHSAARRLVPEHDTAVAEGAAFGQLQIQSILQPAEERRAATQDERVYHELIAVDQPRLAQLRDDAAAAHD